MVKPGDGSTSQQNQRPSGVRRRIMAATTRRSLAVHLGGIAGTIADQLRDGHQSQDGESAPVERADNVARLRRHGDRMMGWILYVVVVIDIEPIRKVSGISQCRPEAMTNSGLLASIIR